MKIRTKLLGVCLLLLIPLILSGIVLVLTQQSLRESIAEARRLGIQQQAASLALQTGFDDAEAALYELQIGTTSGDATEYRFSLARVGVGARDFRNIARSERELLWADQIDDLRFEAEQVGDDLIALNELQTQDLELFGDGSDIMRLQLRDLARSRPVTDEEFHRSVQAMSDEVGDMQRSVSSFLIDRDPQDEEQFAAAEASLNESLTAFSALELTTQERAILDEFTQEFGVVRQSGSSALTNHREAYGLVTHVATEIFPPAQQVVVEDIQSFTIANFAETQLELSSQLATQNRLTLLVGALLLGVALFAVWVLIRGMDRNIAELAAGAGRVADGKMTQPIVIDSRDELAYVGRTFNAMMADLAEREGGMQHRIAQLEALRAAGLQISRLREPDDLVHSVASSSRALIGAEEVRLSSLDSPTGDSLTVEAVAVDPALDRMELFGEPSVLAKTVVRSRRTETDQDSLSSDGVPQRAAFPLVVGDQFFGVLEVSGVSLRAGDLRFIELVTDQIAVAWENARLYRVLADSEQRTGELAVKVAQVQEEERRLVGLDLHDGLTQIVLGARMHLSAGRILIDDGGRTDAAEQLQAAEAQLGAALEELSWMITELRPSELEDYGLRDGLETYASKVADDAGWSLNFRVAGFDDTGLSPAMKSAVFRIVQEALSNARKHAESASIEIDLRVDDGQLVTTITDFGLGFDFRDALQSDHDTVGLAGMRERSELLGGTFEVRSAIGAGTTIISSVPIMIDSAAGTN